LIDLALRLSVETGERVIFRPHLLDRREIVRYSHCFFDALEKGCVVDDLFGNLPVGLSYFLDGGLIVLDDNSIGIDLGLDELEQVAATAALSAAEGAPVARTLSAKCATLRMALATEQESEARLRTSRLTTPIVGMALIFMALVIYPALSFS
jgi:hypothetical protein